MDSARERETSERATPAPVPDAPEATPLGADPLTPGAVVALQRTAGNAAVADMIAAVEDGEAGPGTLRLSRAPQTADAAPSSAEPDSAPPAAGGDGGHAAPPAATNGAAAPPGGATTGAASQTAGTEGGQAAAASGGPAGPAVATEGGQAAAANGGAAHPGGAPRAAPSAAAQTAGTEGGQAAATNGAAAAPSGGAAELDVPPKLDPEQDPRFQALQGRAKGAAAGSKTHAPPQAGAAAAQAAAVPPGNEVASQAAAAQVDEMAEQKPGTFDRKAFIAAVKRAIEAAAPKNLEEASEFKDSGKAGEVKEAVSGQVKDGKQGAEKDIKTATQAPPDTSKAKPKQVTPMSADDPGRPPEGVDAAAAMPPPKAAKETDLSKGPADVDAKMAEAEVTEEQLQKSNEPDFTGALKARQEAKQHSEEAPAGYRKQEQGVLEKAKGEADGAAAPQLTGMHGSRVQAFAKALGNKQEAKGADEQKRAKVAADIESIYTKTKTDVTGILDALDGKVDKVFNDGEQAARKDFEKYVGDRMDAYKDDRYSGLLGKGRWLKDKLLGMPDEVNAFYEEGKTGYLKAMDVVIGQVADVVGAELTAARNRIAQGRAEVSKYVAQLPQDLKQVGKDAEKNLQDRFDQLGQDVDSKQDELVDAVAQKYVKARDDLDARIDELKAANRGLVDKAIDAVAGVIKTILQLKDMLLNVLGKAAGVIGDIIADPIGFLGRLVDGVKSGLSNFLNRIGTHLQNALMNWLFGALGSAGITMPAKLDLAGIFDLVMQVIGLTYQNIRTRVAKLVGEPAVQRMEKTVDIFKTLATKGLAGLWDLVKDQLANLEELVLGQIKEFLIEKVIKAGITWIMALMNPAGAFIRACKAIYDIVMWIVERGAQLMEFVNSVLDSIAAIAKGNIGVVASKVEDALAKALPLAISFLASLIGLGGISDKVRSIIDTVRKPINKAVDFVVLKAVKGFKKLFGKPMAWAKGKYEAGKKWVKGKVDAGKAKVKGALESIDPRNRGKPRTPEEREQQLTDGLAALDAVTARFAGTGATLKQLKGAVAGVKRRFRVFKSIDVVPDGEKWDYVYVASPPREKTGPKRRGTSFSLAPGGLEAQEGRILEGVKAGKPVHLYTKHVNIAEEELVERLEAQKAEFIRLRDERIAAEEQKIVDHEAALTELDQAPEPTSKKERKVVDTVAKRGQEYFKHTEGVKAARKRLAELRRMSPDDRDLMLEQLQNWRGGMPTAVASKFKSGDILEKAIENAIAKNREKIDQAFIGPDGSPKPAGESVTIRATFPRSIGIGYELNERNEVIPARSMMNAIVAILVLVDAEHFVVETAYPE